MLVYSTLLLLRQSFSTLPLLGQSFILSFLPSPIALLLLEKGRLKRVHTRLKVQKLHAHVQFPEIFYWN